jgi:tellurite resistance protein
MSAAFPSSSSRAVDLNVGSTAAIESRPARIPPNFFGIALGLSGLAALWLYASDRFGAPTAVVDGVTLLAASVWILVAAAYVRQGPRQIAADLRDPMVGPFLAAAPISGFLLGEVIAAHAGTAGRVVVIVFLVLGLLLGGWLTGQWMTGGLVEETFSPAFFLPGLGMGFVGSDAAATVGLHSMAEVYFGIGVMAWVLMSSVVFNRMFFRPRLAPPLLPTMAIELAPPAVAGSAYFAIHPAPDPVALGLAGYMAFMVVAQLRLLPLYRALSFTPGFWSFTFPCAAVATIALRWLSIESPAGKTVYAWILIAAVTGLIAAIAARTLLALTRGELLPRATAEAAAITRIGVGTAAASGAR